MCQAVAVHPEAGVRAASGHAGASRSPAWNAGETCLALPKLNLQFLTITDYLLRNFHLFRLEATYEIREDIADVLPRFQVSL